MATMMTSINKQQQPKTCRCNGGGKGEKVQPVGGVGGKRILPRFK
jgi:hypothetical protein